MTTIFPPSVVRSSRLQSESIGLPRGRQAQQLPSQLLLACAFFELPLQRSAATKLSADFPLSFQQQRRRRLHRTCELVFDGDYFLARLLAHLPLGCTTTFVEQMIVSQHGRSLFLLIIWCCPFRFVHRCELLLHHLMASCCDAFVPRIPPIGRSAQFTRALLPLLSDLV